MQLPSLDELQAAARIVYRPCRRRRSIAGRCSRERLGAEVWVKHENHTPVGAFKLRGGLVYFDASSRASRGRGVVAATRGNHGQSSPRARAAHGMPATIVVPHGNSVEKNAAMRALGAELIEHGARLPGRE